MEQYILIIFILILFLILLCWFIKKRIIFAVKSSSQVLKELEKINKSIDFRPINKQYFYSYNCMSRSEFNHFSLENFFLELVGDNQTFFKKIVNSIEHNKREKNKYQNKLRDINFTQTAKIARQTKIPYSIYRHYEKKIYFQQMLPDPVIEVEIICRKEYTTPTGKTHTWSDAKYGYKDIVSFSKKAKTIKKRRAVRSGQIEYERSLMTHSMRYDILKRDNFRCQICGSTAQDGVQLHIDHIIPVSKGGRTIPDNLRVLCDRCNFGKSDKMDEC